MTARNIFAQNCSEMQSACRYVQPHMRTAGLANSTFLIRHKGIVYRARPTRPNMQYEREMKYSSGGSYKGKVKPCVDKKDWSCSSNKMKTSIDRNAIKQYDYLQPRKNATLSITEHSKYKSGASQVRKRPGILELSSVGLAPASQRQNYRPNRRERLEHRNYRIAKWKESDEHSPSNRTEDFETRINRQELISFHHKTSGSITSCKDTELRRIRAVRNMKKMEDMMKDDIKKVEKLQTTDSGIWCEGAPENNPVYTKSKFVNKLNSDSKTYENRPIYGSLVDNPIIKHSNSVDDVSTSEKSPTYRKRYSKSKHQENQNSSRKYKSLSHFYRISSEGSLSSKTYVRRHRNNSNPSDYYRRKHRETYEYDSDESTDSYEQHRPHTSYKNSAKYCRFNESIKQDSSSYSRSKTFSNYPLQQPTHYNVPNYNYQTSSYFVPQAIVKNNYNANEKQLIKAQPKPLLSNCYPEQTIIYQCACGECKKLYCYPCKMKEKSHVKFSTKRTKSEQSISSVTSGRIIEMFSICFRCFDSDEGTLSSGGSDTASCGGADGDVEEDGFQEHGDDVSVDDGSDGGDSGSESGGEVSLNSAELFDDQNNLFDIKTALGGDESDDGPGSAGSDCSDSLTELRSRSKKGSEGSDGEGAHDTITDDDFEDSWESLAIYERE